MCFSHAHSPLFCKKKGQPEFGMATWPNTHQTWLPSCFFGCTFCSSTAATCWHIVESLLEKNVKWMSHYQVQDTHQKINFNLFLQSKIDLYKTMFRLKQQKNSWRFKAVFLGLYIFFPCNKQIFDPRLTWAVEASTNSDQIWPLMAERPPPFWAEIVAGKTTGLLGFRGFKLMEINVATAVFQEEWKMNTIFLF